MQWRRDIVNDDEISLNVQRNFQKNKKILKM